MLESHSGREVGKEDIPMQTSGAVQAPIAGSPKSVKTESSHTSDPPQGGIQYVGIPDPRPEGEVERKRQGYSFLTPNSSPALRSFLTPASNRASHLPTPHSPNDISLSLLGSAYDSPVRPENSSSRSSSSHQQRDMSCESVPPNGLFPTPESSPLYPRRPGSSRNPSTPSPPRTPRPSSSRPAFQSEAKGNCHARNASSFPSFTPPPRSLDVSPPPRSTLSSPFVDRSAPRTPTHTQRSRSRITSPDASPMAIDDRFTLGPSTSTAAKSATPLKAPVPTRPVGGEMSRIRLQLAAEQAVHHDDAETRRPEYLKRVKRPSSELEFDFDDYGGMDGTALLGVESVSKTNTNMGVTESPVKGRRIALFQETSEESFEQSLLAGGYPRYGDLPAYTDPQTPQNAGDNNNNKSKAAMSQRALEWLQNPTPGRVVPLQINGAAGGESDQDWVPSEKEIRKRKRLAAFEDERPSATKAKLIAVEVEGRGRVLLDKLLDDTPVSPSASPGARKRGGVRRKRARANSPAKKGGKSRGPAGATAGDENVAENEEVSRPNWLDAEFPWSMRAKERREWTKRDREEKLKWIERFLERDSDEESEGEDQSLGIPPAAIDEDGDKEEDEEEEEEDSAMFRAQPPRPGRGKMVPLKANPDSHTLERIMFPSDPADARAALLSKRSVRALAFRRRQQQGWRDNVEIGEDEEVCICHGRDDGRELVQCDECHTWYHLECIGIRSIEELGREEDPWYCADCLDDALPNEEPSSEPTFVPTDDQPARRRLRDPLMSSGSSGLSPAVAWPSSSRVPRTPVRTRDVREPFSSSSWEASSSMVGPTTPRSGTRHGRLYRTPTIYDGSDDLPFASTPSRRLSGAFTTPKTSLSALWGTRSSGPFQTPSRSRRSGGTFPFTLDDSANRTPYRSVMAYPYDDTPIRRTKPLREDARVSAGASARLMSDSKGRGTGYALSMPESPTVARLSARKARGGAKVNPGTP